MAKLLYQHWSKAIKFFRTKFLAKPWLWMVLASLALLLLIAWLSIRFAWFPGKTIWDWLQLLVIPAALALVALVFNQMNTRTERQIAKQRYEQDQQITRDKQREDLLQTYFDRMSELLLKEGLRTSQPDAEVRNIARARTISILRQLDGRRVGDVFVFLREAGLIDATEPIVSLRRGNFLRVDWSFADLSGADLSGANLGGARLDFANLSGALLREALLGEAWLIGADLSRANLSKANLRLARLNRANLSGADLSGADLSAYRLGDPFISGADLRGANLSGTNLRGANLDRAIFKYAIVDKDKLTPEQIAQATW